jgi:hypothetical protein
MELLKIMKPLQQPHGAAAGEGGRDKTPVDLIHADPELHDAHTGAGRIAIYAVAIAVLLGAVLFGLDSKPAIFSTSPPPASSGSVAALPSVRDVTPNRQSGTTIGTAPSQPAPPQANPTKLENDGPAGR